MNATRRAVLAGTGAAAVVGLAGCAGGSVAESDGNARLAYVRLVNRHSSAHVVHVLVQRGGDPVHWSSHDLAAADDGSAGDAAATVEATWADDAGDFSVFVRLDDDTDWREFDVGDGSVNCYGVETRITTEGTVESLFSKNPGDCGSDATADSAETS